MVNIDWTAVNPKVKEAIDHVIEAQKIYNTLDDAGKEKFDFLTDILAETQERVNDVKE